MMAVRTTEDLDSIHSYYVDQWDWEASIKKSERNFETLKKYVTKIVGALAATQEVVLKKYPELQRVIAKKPIKFITTQELEDRWPKLSSKEREHAIAREYKGTLFISQIGGKLKSGKIHDGRSPDYDDWSLNGDIVIYYPPFDSSLELSSMGIRVDAVALKSQLAERKALDRMKYDFHKKLLAETLPFTIGGGIGQSRVCMVLLNKTHIGEVQASQWSDEVVSDAKKRKIALL
jgi:aspartate--ammonia ligase